MTETLGVDLRDARLDDAELLFKTKNEPEVRRFSIVTKDEIKFEDHLRWLKEVLEDGGRKLFVITYLGNYAGNLLLWLQKDGRVEVQIRIDDWARGNGVGSAVLRQALCNCKRGTYTAKIVEGNFKSLNLFMRNGFNILGYENGVYFLERQG